MERRRADPFSQPSNMDTDHLSSYLSLTSDNPHFDQTQLSHYESALSSLVSSPTTTQPSNDSLVLRELIGRLGTICYNNNNNASVEDVINSANNSSYSTPLNSPPKVMPLRLPSFNGQLSRVSSCQSLMDVGMTGGAHLEENGANNDNLNNLNNNNSSGGSNSNGRKRKASVKGKGKETHLASCSNHNSKISEEDSGVKRCKPDCEGGLEMKNVNSDNNSNGQNNNELKNETENTPEPVKDYIHVRARRGQATDSHSLAERVRREKISERMKLLQDLVPGCNKVTGKAVMLDEIINYVQSLQRQVEFLSMKLATVNTQLDFTMDNIISKDMPHESYPSSSFANPNQAQMGPLNSILTHNGIPNIPSDAFMNVDPNSQIGAIWDDLQSVVQMGFLQGQEGVLSSQSYHGSVPSSSQTKL